MIDFLQNLHAQIFDPDRLPVAILALLLTGIGGFLTGPIGSQSTPAFWRMIVVVFGGLGQRMDKPGRPVADLAMRGFVLTMLVLLAVLLFGQFFTVLTQNVPDWRVADVLALVLILSGGAVWKTLSRVYKVLEGKTKESGAYLTLARSTRCDLSSNDNYTITRCAMGWAARDFDKGMVAPVLWYLIAGVPGAFLYAGLAALTWRYGRDGFTSGFAQVPLALEKLMGFVPNVLAGLLLALAGAFTPTAMITRGLNGWMRPKGRATYEQGGLPLTSMAWALKASLGGPFRDLDGSAMQGSWAEPPDATAQLEPKHLHRALYMCVMAYILFIASLAVAIVISGHNLLSVALDF